MPDKYTTAEDMEEDRRRREDPCYYGHDYVEYDRREKSETTYETVSDCNCPTEYDLSMSMPVVTSSCGGYCGTRQVENTTKWTEIYFRCSQNALGYSGESKKRIVVRKAD